MARKNKHKCSWLADESGVAAVLFALLAALLLGLVALSVDVGHIGVVRTELQNAADACALAGARGFFPNIMPDPQPPPKPADAQSTANAWIGRNPADNYVLSSLSDVQTGTYYYAFVNPDGTTGKFFSSWSWDTPSVYFGLFVGPSVTVTVRKEGTTNNGPIQNALAAVFGVPTSDAEARATAALSGVGGFLKDAPVLPIALNMDLLKDGVIVNFSPDNADVGGWTGMLGNANTATIKALIDAPLPGDVPSGSLINLLNGESCALFKEIIDHYNLKNPANADNPEKGVYLPKDLNFFAPVVTKIKFNQDAQVVGGVGFQLVEIRDSNEDFIVHFED